jgi:hypothetical protein
MWYFLLFLWVKKTSHYLYIDSFRQENKTFLLALFCKISYICGTYTNDKLFEQL